MKSRYSNIRGRARLGGQTIGRYRSKLERSVLIKWQLDPAVARARLNSDTIRYVAIDGTERPYTPDLVLEWLPRCQRRTLAIETKYQSELERDPTLAKKHALVKQAFARVGYDFEVHTENEVFTPELSTKAFILGHFNDPVHAREGEILERIVRGGAICLGELLADMSGDPRERLTLVPTVWRLVAQRRIYIDYFGPLGDTTELRAPLPAER